jgi:hypothetical protein
MNSNQSAVLLGSTCYIGYSNATHSFYELSQLKVSLA